MNNKSKKFALKITLGIVLSILVIVGYSSNEVAISVDYKSDFKVFEPVSITIETKKNYRKFNPDSINLSVYNKYNQEEKIELKLSPYKVGTYEVIYTPIHSGEFILNLRIEESSNVSLHNEKFEVVQ